MLWLEVFWIVVGVTLLFNLLEDFDMIKNMWRCLLCWLVSSVALIFSFPVTFGILNVFGEKRFYFSGDFISWIWLGTYVVVSLFLFVVADWKKPIQNKIHCFLYWFFFSIAIILSSFCMKMFVETSGVQSFEDLIPGVFLFGIMWYLYFSLFIFFSSIILAFVVKLSGDRD